MGRIGKPHGIRGEVYVERISDDPGRFEIGSELIHEDGRTLRVASARAHRDRFLVRFEGIESRADAEDLRGALFAPSGTLRTLGEDEYWAHELIGCVVVTGAGAEVGRVEGVVDAPAQDLLVVATPAGERYVPMVRELVPEIDLAARRVVVTPPEGLLD